MYFLLVGASNGKLESAIIVAVLALVLLCSGVFIKQPNEENSAPKDSLKQATPYKPVFIDQVDPTYVPKKLKSSSHKVHH